MCAESADQWWNELRQHPAIQRDKELWGRVEQLDVPQGLTFKTARREVIDEGMGYEGGRINNPNNDDLNMLERHVLRLET